MPATLTQRALLLSLVLARLLDDVVVANDNEDRGPSADALSQRGIRTRIHPSRRTRSRSA